MQRASSEGAPRLTIEPRAAGVESSASWLYYLAVRSRRSPLPTKIRSQPPHSDFPKCVLIHVGVSELNTPISPSFIAHVYVRSDVDLILSKITPAMALPFDNPASLSPAFVISRCDSDDVDPMCITYYDAFDADPGNSHWWSPSREQMMIWMRRRISKKMADRSIRHFKITEVASGEMVAFARWDIPQGSTNFGDWVGIKNEVSDVSSLVNSDQEGTNGRQAQEVPPSAPVVELQPRYVGVDVPEGADPALATNFFGRLAVASEKWYRNDMLGECLHSDQVQRADAQFDNDCRSIAHLYGS